MKKIATVLLTSVLLASANFANAAADITRLTNTICELVKSDNRSGLRKKLKSTNLNLRSVYDGLVCQAEGSYSGGSLMRTASFYGSSEISKFLIRKIKKEQLGAKEHDGSSVVEWSEKALQSGSIKDAEKTKAILSEIKSKLAS